MVSPPLRMVSDEERHALCTVSNLEQCELPITTMVIIFQLEGEPAVNERVAYLLLPWEVQAISEDRQKPKVVKLKDMAFDLPVGTIFSLRHEGKTRGLRRSMSQRFLKNSASIDMVITPRKHINVKLSGCRLHMCGPNQQSQASLALNVMMDHLARIQEVIQYIISHVAEAKRALDYAKEVLRGDLVARNIYHTVTYVFRKQRYQRSTRMIDVTVYGESGNDAQGNPIPQKTSMRLSSMRMLEKTNWSFVREVQENNNVSRYTHVIQEKALGTEDVPGISNRWTSLSDFLADAPAEIDQKCLGYYTINAFRDHDRYNTWLAEADYLAQHNLVYKHAPVRVVLQKALVNFNFGIGFIINRHAFTHVFSQHPHFITVYDNIRAQNIFISLPYFSTNGEICRKKKNSCITFIVYQTGRVTLTGPHESLNRIALIAFMDHVRTNRHLIEQVVDDDEKLSDTEDVVAVKNTVEVPETANLLVDVVNGNIMRALQIPETQEEEEEGEEGSEEEEEEEKLTTPKRVRVA